MADLPPGPYFKVLGKGLKPHHGGTGKWTVGKWRSVKGELVACENGLHFVTRSQLLGWLGPVICPFEPAPDTEVIVQADKLVCRKGRIGKPYANWNDRSARLFAADCAERVLPIFERKHPDDDRPRKAIEAARQFANGEIDAAARAAAWAAAGAAARAAAWAAAGAAAGDAARDAAGAAARAAARDAVWDAAGDAARDAAWNAAWAVERSWQTEHLMQVLGVEVGV